MLTQSVTAPAPFAVAPPPSEQIKPFPIQPGEIWDAPAHKTRVVIWQVENARCAFWRGAVKLGLRRIQRGRVLFVKTTVEELAKLLIWSWEDRLPTNGAAR